MIHSMTGFGRGQAAAGGIAVNAELKSVNSRYLDISFRLPKEIQPKELKLKERIQSRIARGNVNVQIRIDKAETGQPAITINPKLSRGYKKLLDDLRQAAGIEEPVSLRDLTQFDAIFTSRQEDPQTLDAIWSLTRQAVDQALEQLVVMRSQEGRQLHKDLHQRATHIEEKIEAIQTLTRGQAQKNRDQLLKRIHKLMDEEQIDSDRLEMEVAILVDKTDITEEIVRLQSHIKFFKEALDAEESAGRRLKFLSQEMNREINTIGSKANHSEISQQVVQAKESLEQIREQIQNVE